MRKQVPTEATMPNECVVCFGLIRDRRALGLLCFYYVPLHFTVYLALDQELVLNAVIADVAKRPFIMLGMAGFALLVPLAVTSNSFSIRRLGKNWIRLHRLVYGVAVCGGIHFPWRRRFSHRSSTLSGIACRPRSSSYTGLRGPC
ncbi:protein-methionine-sulfoxide reductase heme-binding subunit MsrQ [Mesorhizobium sp. A623]